MFSRCSCGNTALTFPFSRNSGSGPWPLLARLWRERPLWRGSGGCYSAPRPLRTHTRTRMQMHAYTHKCAHKRTNKDIQTHKYTYKRMCTHTHSHTRTRLCTHTQSPTHTQNISLNIYLCYIYIYMRIYSYIYIWDH